MRIPKLRRLIGTSAAAMLVGVSLASTSGSAAADEVSALDTCDRGEVCVYQGNTLIASSHGNLSGPYGPMEPSGRVVNNGRWDPGLDHIRYELRSGGSTTTVCLHYPGDGNTSGSIPANGVVSNIRWGPGC